MKIIEETPELLVLKDNAVTGFIGGIVFVLVGGYVLFRQDIPFWGGLAAIAIGLGIILLSRITTITLDKNIKKINFRWKKIIGEQSREYSFDQAQRIELRESYNQTKQGTNRSLQTIFVFKNGEEIPLTSSGSSVRLQGIPITVNQVGALGQKVAAFIGVPYEEHRGATATEMISAVQTAIQNAAQTEMEKQKKEPPSL